MFPSVLLNLAQSPATYRQSVAKHNEKIGHIQACTTHVRNVFQGVSDMDTQVQLMHYVSRLLSQGEIYSGRVKWSCSMSLRVGDIIVKELPNAILFCFYNPVSVWIILALI